MTNFQPREVVNRCSETQLQVAENLNKLTQQEKGQYNVNVISHHLEKSFFFSQ